MERKRSKTQVVMAVAIFALVLFTVQGCATQAISPGSPGASLSVNNVVFRDNYRGPGSEGKPQSGYFAAKYWKGQPQIMCYNSATRNDLPAATLQVMLDHLSNNPPQTAADLANENFARREFSINTASALAARAVQQAGVATKLTENEVVFNNNFADANKPQSGYFAAKYWKGQPQIMCYNSATRNDLPAATLQVMLDHLSNNPPQTAADLANENFARREFSINVASVPAATSKVTTATVAAVAPAPATPDPNTELSALKAKLATVEAAEVKRLADAKVEADEKARVATRVKACLAGLKTLGYEDGGVVTIDKIKEFQGKMKLDDDGEVGPATCRAVGLALKAREDCLAKKAAGQSCE